MTTGSNYQHETQLTVGLIRSIFAVRIRVAHPSLVNALTRAAASELATEMALVIRGNVIRRAVHLIRAVGTVKTTIASPSGRNALRTVALPLARWARHWRCRCTPQPIYHSTLVVVKAFLYKQVTSCP